MRQKRTHVQQSLGLKSRVRTSFRRSKFVSYSGLGSPKSKVKRNENTPRIPYNYTNKQKWDTFFTNGRPRFHKSCLLLCDVILEAGRCSFWEESHSHLPGEHAEVKALKFISTMEQQADIVARFVKMYMSYSPCAKCADFIIDFSTARPHCQLSLVFSCLFRHVEDRHRDGLRRLNAAPRIFLGVFTNLEWMHVAKATGTPFHYHSPRRQSGDLKWRAEFENILKEQPGAPALCPSVPSQERDWASVSIQPTHIPQDQGSTAGAATSSGLSQGRSSQMWGQSRDVQREVLLDAVTTETAELGATALRPSVPSQERDWASVTIQPPHNPQDQVSTAGAAMSSGLSQGRSSQMWGQSRDVQREVLLDAVTIETVEPGATALRPSVPSQERDWASVTIRPTHIPQDQGSTAGAAMSSGLSQGRSSQMWWQSRDVQREVLLDAVTIETAEPGTTALRPSISSQESDSSSIIIQPIHIPQDQGWKAGAATSSGLSRGRPFRTWWQSHDEQREKLLDAVTVETAEAVPDFSLLAWPGATALHPSMPSQERDWASVTIQPTHIPQDQRSTAGAARSSGLSQGRSSQMWRQSRDVQREEVLDAVTIETAEQNVAVTRSVKKWRVYFVIVAVVIVLIITVTLLSVCL